MNARMIKLSIAIMMVAIMVMACTLPGAGGGTPLKSGPTQTQAISVPLPADTSQPINVILRLAGAEITAGPGTAKLVEGSVQYNVAEYQPTVTTSGSEVNISQGPSGGIKGIPPSDMVNKWNLKFGAGAPMNLDIKAGGYEGTWELGGLRLQTLKWEEGASKSTISFSQANPVKMDSFSFVTGASTVKFNKLANLNCAKMTFQSGVGEYTFDFGGNLKQSASVEIKTGLSDVTIIIPTNVAARISLKSAVSDVTTKGAWTTAGTTYTTGKYDTAQVKLDITIDMGLGHLTLDTR